MNRKKHKQAHTSAPRGKRIRVVMKDGREFVDKFIERRPHDVVFEGRTVAAGEIQSFTIYRQLDANSPCCGKIDYRSEETATKAAKSMARKKGEDYGAYKCDEGAWHVGHSRKSIEISFEGLPTKAQIADALKRAGLNPSDHVAAITKQIKRVVRRK